MSTLQLLGQAPLAVLIHLATVVPAFFLGTWLIVFSTKGSAYHRLAGKAYLTLMAVTAVAALFVRSFSAWSLTFGPFKLGLIHLFVLLTAHGIWQTLRALAAGDIAAHRGSMKGMYFGAMIVAGLLSLVPGRLMHRLLFG